MIEVLSKCKNLREDAHARSIACLSPFFRFARICDHIAAAAACGLSVRCVSRLGPSSTASIT